MRSGFKVSQVFGLLTGIALASGSAFALAGGGEMEQCPSLQGEWKGSCTISGEKSDGTFVIEQEGCHAFKMRHFSEKPLLVNKAVMESDSWHAKEGNFVKTQTTYTTWVSDDQAGAKHLRVNQYVLIHNTSKKENPSEVVGAAAIKLSSTNSLELNEVLNIRSGDGFQAIETKCNYTR